MRQQLLTWWQRLRARSPLTHPRIGDELWQQTLEDYPFLQALTTQERRQLRALSELFLRSKEFTGVQGVAITDAMAVAIAAQACVLVVHWGPPTQALRWYRDFVGIIVYPGEMQAQRTWVDTAGVVHSGTESLVGDAMDGGPVTLSWSAIAPHAKDLGPGSNVVIHEFAHKLDMAYGGSDGCPPLPSGFAGCHSVAEARTLWSRVWSEELAQLQDAWAAHERFGQAPPYLDAYACSDAAEFFAMACEAYWVDAPAFAAAHPRLMPLLHALFRRDCA